MEFPALTASEPPGMNAVESSGGGSSSSRADASASPASIACHGYRYCLCRTHVAREQTRRANRFTDGSLRKNGCVAASSPPCFVSISKCVIISCTCWGTKDTDDPFFTASLLHQIIGVWLAPSPPTDHLTSDRVHLSDRQQSRWISLKTDCALTAMQILAAAPCGGNAHDRMPSTDTVLRELPRGPFEAACARRFRVERRVR